jgi:hypothetical protein
VCISVEDLLVCEALRLCWCRMVARHDDSLFKYDVGRRGASS